MSSLSWVTHSLLVSLSFSHQAKNFTWKTCVKERHTPVIPSSSTKKRRNMTRDRFLMILEDREVEREDDQTAVYSLNRDIDSRVSLRIWWLVFFVHFSDCLLFFIETVFEMMKSFVCFSPIRFQDLDDVLFLLFHQFFLSDSLPDHHSFSDNNNSILHTREDSHTQEDQRHHQQQLIEKIGLNERLGNRFWCLMCMQIVTEIHFILYMYFSLSLFSYYWTQGWDKDSLIVPSGDKSSMHKRRRGERDYIKDRHALVYCSGWVKSLNTNVRT